MNLENLLQCKHYFFDASFYFFKIRSIRSRKSLVIQNIQSNSQYNQEQFTNFKKTYNILKQILERKDQFQVNRLKLFWIKNDFKNSRYQFKIAKQINQEIITMLYQVIKNDVQSYKQYKVSDNNQDYLCSKHDQFQFINQNQFSQNKDITFWHVIIKLGLMNFYKNIQLILELKIRKIEYQNKLIYFDKKFNNQKAFPKIIHLFYSIQNGTIKYYLSKILFRNERQNILIKSRNFSKISYSNKHEIAFITHQIIFFFKVLKVYKNIFNLESNMKIKSTINHDHLPNQIFRNINDTLVIYQILNYYNQYSIQQKSMAAYLDADKITMSVMNKSVLGTEPIKIQAMPNLQVKDIKLKLTQQEWANAQLCNICKQNFNPAKYINKHHCRVCGSSVCGECSKKKLNNERVCDFCFLKQYLKKQSHERKQMLRSRQLAIQKMTEQSVQNEKKIEELDIEINKLQQSNITLEMQQTKTIRELQAKIKNMQQQHKLKQEALNQRKAKLEQRHKQLMSRQQKNKIFGQKVKMLKLDISCKQISQLQKMQELQRLKLQLQNLQKQRKQVLKDLQN